jgi:molybdopterin biosynthesis enzyme
VRIEKVALNKAVNHILLHHLVGPDGRKMVKKGQRLTPADISMLKDLGYQAIYVAILAAEDVNENEAAARLGQLITRPGIEPTSATTGRVNLLAAAAGLFKVNPERLLAFNEVAGITLATLPSNTPVQPKTMLGTLKIIPYAVSPRNLQTVEAIAAEPDLLELKPFIIRRAALIATGSPAAREKVLTGFIPAIQERLANYGTELIVGPYVAEDEAEISQALRNALSSGAGLVVVVGETSIMDENDITPQAVRVIGGEIVQYGLPVEPGNLMLLAYHGNVPIVGAPGCARSKSHNVVDMVLPRLAAGERLTRRDLLQLGHGGLLV